MLWRAIATLWHLRMVVVRERHLVLRLAHLERALARSCSPISTEVKWRNLGKWKATPSDEKIKARHNSEDCELDPPVSPRDPIFSLGSVHAYALWTTSA